MNNDEVEALMNEFIEIELKDPQDFNKVRETLTRIGISNKDNELFQSCHIFQKRGRFFIVHFKRLFKLDGKESTLSEEDIARENTIALLLEDWGLIKIKNKEKMSDARVNLAKIKIVKYNEKQEYTLRQKYTIGNKKNRNRSEEESFV